MKSNGACADALTHGDDIAWVSTKGFNILADPYRTPLVCMHDKYVQALTFECSTLISQPIIRLLRGYQSFAGGKTEYYATKSITSCQ